MSTVTTDGSNTSDAVVYSLEGKTLKLNTAEDVKQYVDEIIATKGLTEIRLSGNTFGVEAGRAIAHALKDQHSLRIASLSDMFTGRLRNEIPLVLEALAEALEDKVNLVELDLSDNAFGPAGAEPLQRLLINNRNIQVLRLNNNGLGIEGARLVAEALVTAAEKNKAEERKPALRVVVAGRNRMESKGIQHLCKAFEAHGESLREIRMPQNSIRPEGIQVLMEALAACKNLEHLDLQDNTFTDVGSRSLAKVLPTWEKLRILHVGDCLLSASGSLAVLKALTPGHLNLERLHLAFNEMDSEGAGYVAGMLLNKKNLVAIELNGNAFDPEGDAVRDIKRVLLGHGHEEALDELDEMEWEEEEEEEEAEEEEEEKVPSEAEGDDEVSRLTATLSEKLKV
ncbi:GTPase-activating protein RNA1 [Spizellomyces punctatus DAOM BR117]|uniref:Ran GTPase-activating protein 1 n=1 Tax=Spizellomyces punctatus (strain DAOM BR117) TaxID=645134 RepID=A0A0L0H896_SPIPD|nr:GTPase-activating protein RNA1 [Spizellomyces punctatus DAOM BR117]KNC97149.1 hypothetical protein SPPG_07539 [Spizellomyces punctatus DAOM BR117]|eukprot:XP_016605189.1 hypothetical protein SPPG_07539 [Spizellomyces punctatus DAOM BR117]